MLRQLQVANFALIDQLQLHFSPGLNIITGETGAGKSILMEALLAIFGSRLSTDIVRHATDYCRIEAVLDSDARCDALLEQWGLEAAEEGEIILSRRYQKTGKNVIHINGCAATLSQLRQLGAVIADVHGQNEHLALFRPDVLRTLLDQYCGPEHQVVLREYQEIFRKWKAAQDRLRLYQAGEEQRRQRINALRWETEEIAQAGLRADEEEEARQRLLLLLNTEKIRSALESVRQNLEGDERRHGAIVLAANALRELTQIAQIDSTLLPQAELLQDMYYSLKEIWPDLRNYQEGLAVDPERIDQLQRRLDQIDKLKRKYGPTVADVLRHFETAVAEIAQTETDEHEAERLEIAVTALQQAVGTQSEVIRQRRQEGAVALAGQLQTILHNMGMEHTQIVVQVAARESPDQFGQDTISLLFSANVGEAPKPLQEVISGGELSRLALAIKSLPEAEHSAQVQIFDEIDAGIGGMTATRIAEHLGRLAAKRQIICITHLPQIAAMADRHFSVTKQMIADATVSQVFLLDEEQQLEEMVRLTAGNQPTEVLLASARHVLVVARAFKQAMSINPVETNKI